jgi:iron(III) transport system ATP-binding protein
MKRDMNHHQQVQALELEALTLGYPTASGLQVVLSDFSLSLAQGEIACLLGPSGCGKTTALRAIAGFHPLQSGRICLMQDEVCRAGYQLAPEHRNIGMVFQDYALFPHLSVADNIGFGLYRRSKHEREQRVAQMLELVGMKALAHSAPHQLSGGQQQRVALARALAPQPSLLLMDEPFSNLDVTLRERLAIEVRDLLKQTGTTAVIVTHDQQEAFAVADRIAVLAEGRLQQWGTPMQLYHRPQNRFVARFVGEGMMLRGQLGDTGQVHTELGVFKPDALPDGVAKGGEVDLLVRPDDIQHDDASPLQARVLAKAFRGATFLYTLALPTGQQLLSLVPSHHDHAIGEAIGIRLELDHQICFATD